MKPTIGRIVHYTLSQGDVDEINRQRREAGSASKTGNFVEEGQVYPAIIVRVWETAAANLQLQVFLDGNDTYWATSREIGEGPGFAAWPARD